jgi:hypothetical protein
MNKNNLYRLSALLYRDDSNSLNRTTTISKIIESFFVIISNEAHEFQSLSDKIYKEFSLLFHDEELIPAINPKYFDFEYPDAKNQGIRNSIISLKEERYQYLKTMQNQNNIYRHIVNFYRDSGYTDEIISLTDFTKLIQNFLYKIFVQNLEKSKSLFDKSLDISDLVEKISFSNDEKELINMFLDYDSPGKDKAIFNIGSWAVEFATINGDVELENQLNNITHKTLYLDTNVLFRLIGIDGERRQKRLINFLERCKTSGQSLKITKTVMDEYHKSFEIGVKHIISLSPKVKYTDPIPNSIVQHYFNSNGISVDIFLAETEMTFNEHIKNLGIQIESYDFYAEADGKHRLKIDKYSEDIMNYKHQTHEFQSLPDATNIVYIGSLREGHGCNFNDSMYFFLTVDKALTKWEQNTFDGCPVTMRPSDWLTLLLKYLTRTGNDYRAFVSFIQTVIQTEQKEPETVMAMLDGISQIADKLENQEQLYSILVSQKYNEILAIDTYVNKVEYSKELANSIMEEKIRKLEEDRLRDRLESNEQFDAMKAHLDDTKQMLELVEKKNEKMLSEKDEKIRRDRKKHLKYVKKTEKSKIVQSCVAALFFFVPSVIGIVLTWFFTDQSWNHIYKLINQTDNTLSWQMFLTATLLVFLAPSVSVLWNHLIGDKNLKSRMISAGFTEDELDS